MGPESLTDVLGRGRQCGRHGPPSPPPTQEQELPEAGAEPQHPLFLWIFQTQGGVYIFKIGWEKLKEEEFMTCANDTDFPCLYPDTILLKDRHTDMYM